MTFLRQKKRVLSSLMTTMAITLLMFGLIYGTDLHKYRIPNYTDEELEQMRIERIVNMLMDTKSGTIIGYSFGNKEAHTWMVVSHNDTGKKVLYGHPPSNHGK